MFGKGLKLFSLFGFDVRVDASWLLLAVLIILILSGGYFPVHYEDLSGTEYLVMGILGALGLFLSIILHELSHSLVARRFGMPMKGITLFMFGGVAQMEDEARTPKGEICMAIAGPIASFVLAGLFFALHIGARAADFPPAITGVPGYLAWINVVLAFFNLLPAFPLDGGRILRSALWAWKKNLRWATRIASGIGSAFGVGLILIGILGMLGGQFIGGLWWALIGMFLRGISQGSYRQIMIRETLSGEPVRRFMHENPVTVPPEITVDKLVQDYVYRYHFKMFPVVENGVLTGCVNTRDIKETPRNEWETRTVSDLAHGCSDQNSVAPDADAADALSTMHKTGNSRLVVEENGRLVGVVTLKDMLRFLSLKLDLEGEEADAEKIRRTIAQ